ncbi:hypothetical protein NX784_26740 [Massilia pinisoli]|uniref:Uncharacterized protein n=1 Tax=Massilia pinisoli TaxID=1772194 RepID=A0ABT1ZZ33_9BURK|nr:hypothetical protein [Massilia pinisoli]MCS0585186.1 hypothetical protein [Massilia pinisoli]
MMNNEKITESEKPISPTAILIAVNFFAVVLYLAAASSGWVEPELESIPGASGGGAMVWFLLAVPIFLLSFLGNVVSLVFAVIRRFRTGCWNIAWWAWPAVLGLWVLAVAFDFSRHGT